MKGAAVIDTRTLRVVVREAGGDWGHEGRTNADAAGLNLTETFSP